MPPDNRISAGKPKSASQLLRSQSPRQFQQRQRVAVSLGEDLIAHPRIERSSQRRIQQRSRVCLLQPLDPQLRQPRQLAARYPDREDHANRFRHQTARNEPKDLRRGAIEPLLVIDQTHKRLLLGDLGQQAQDPQPDQKPVGCRSGTHAEGSAARHHAAAPVNAAGYPAWARTTDAMRRRPIPSRTAHPRCALSGNPTHSRPNNQATRSCRHPLRQTPPTPDSDRRESAATNRSSVSRSASRSISSIAPPRTLKSAAICTGSGDNLTVSRAGRGRAACVTRCRAWRTPCVGGTGRCAR